MKFWEKIFRNINDELIKDIEDLNKEISDLLIHLNKADSGVTHFVNRAIIVNGKQLFSPPTSKNKFREELNSHYLELKELREDIQDYIKFQNEASKKLF